MCVMAASCVGSCHDWMRQNIFIAPAAIDASGESRQANACQFGPLRDGASQAIVCQKSIRAFVVLLLLKCGPAAIVRFVIASLVRIAVQGVSSRRALTHVSQERDKASAPFFAHRDTRSTINGVMSMCWIKAAHLCVHPCFIRDGNTLNAVAMRFMFHGCHCIRLVCRWGI